MYCLPQQRWGGRFPSLPSAPADTHRHWRQCTVSPGSANVPPHKSLPAYEAQGEQQQSLPQCTPSQRQLPSSKTLSNSLLFYPVWPHFTDEITRAHRVWGSYLKSQLIKGTGNQGFWSGPSVLFVLWRCLSGYRPPARPPALVENFRTPGWVTSSYTGAALQGSASILMHHLAPKFILHNHTHWLSLERYTVSQWQPLIKNWAK